MPQGECLWWIRENDVQNLKLAAVSRDQSCQRLVDMALDTVSDFREYFLRVLQKVRRGAVGFECGVILVLLIDEKTARFGLVAVHLIGDAARFFAGLFG